MRAIVCKGTPSTGPLQGQVRYINRQNTKKDLCLLTPPHHLTQFVQDINILTPFNQLISQIKKIMWVWSFASFLGKTWAGKNKKLNCAFSCTCIPLSPSAGSLARVLSTHRLIWPWVWHFAAETALWNSAKVSTDHLAYMWIFLLTIFCKINTWILLNLNPLIAYP